MVLECLTTGMLGSNCYIVGNEGEGVIIDAGAKVEDILKIIENKDLKIKYIILTHAHIDHIAYMDELRKKLGAKVMLHEKDAKALADSLLNGSRLFGAKKIFGDADIMLKDGSSVDIGGMKLDVIHTPGHSSGSICIKTGNILFTGDTLFRKSIGRTDLGDGSWDQIMNSLNKLMELEDDVVVYPGHGDSTTIGFERTNNPFLKS